MSKYKIIPVLLLLTLLLPIIEHWIEGQITVSIDFETPVRSLSPIDSTGQYWGRLFNQIFEKPFKFSRNGKLKGQLVKNWTTNKEYTEFYFELIDEDVYFHNGKKMTVEDVVYSLNYVTKKAATPEGNYLASNIESISKVSDRSFKIILKRREIDFLYFLASPVVRVFPRDLFSSGEEKDPTKLWIGTGPFKFKSIEFDRIVLERFSNYRERVKIKQLSFINSKQKFQLFDEGVLDVVEIARNEVERYQQQPNTIAASYYTLGTFYLGFRLSHPKFKNRNLRMAIYHAIDRQRIIEGDKIASSKIPSSPVPFGLPGYRPSKIEYNPEKAKYYLSKVPRSQLPTANEMEILIPESLHPMGYYAINRIKSDLKAIGLPLRYKLLTKSYGKGRLSDYYHHLRTQNDYSMYIRALITAIPSTGFILKETLTKAGQMNFGGYYSKELEALLATPPKQIDPESMSKYYEEAIDIAEHDAPMIPLGNLKTNFAMKREKELNILAISPMFLHFKDAL